MTRRRFRRHGADYLLDRARGRFVLATPEELVRQNELDWLIDDLGVPERLVRSEFNQRRRGGSGRSDIVVLAPGSTDSDGEALLVVECKRAGMFLDDKTLEQASRYASDLGARRVLLTNGRTRLLYAHRNNRWRRMELPQDWRGLRSRSAKLAKLPAKWRRWHWRDLADLETAAETAEWSGSRGIIIGEDSPDHLCSLALNLFGLLADDRERAPVPRRRGQYRLLVDVGQTRRSFGNSAGGSWSSDFYRSFAVRDLRRSTDYIVSMTVLAGMKTRNHPTFGNRNGKTTLVVGVDDEMTSHVSMELCLDKCAPASEFRSGRVCLRHDGRMTAGKRGSVKRQRVLDFVRQRAPDLVQPDGISLGNVNLQRELRWPDALPLIFNLIRYALIRDELRAELRGVKLVPA